MPPLLADLTTETMHRFMIYTDCTEASNLALAETIDDWLAHPKWRINRDDATMIMDRASDICEERRQAARAWKCARSLQG